VLLVVEDNDGAQDSDSSVVTVDAPNNSPAAAYSFNCDDLLCDFDAGLSSDSDGQIVSYEWDFGDGFTLQTASVFVQHQFASEGQYSVRLTVRDNEGAQGQAQSLLEVFAPVVNQEPTAIYSYSCPILIVNSTQAPVRTQTEPLRTIHGISAMVARLKAAGR